MRDPASSSRGSGFFPTGHRRQAESTALTRTFAPAAEGAGQLWPTLLEVKPREFVRSWPGAVGVYLCVAAFVCFFGLGWTDSVSMEGMVADAARTMVKSGDWIVPRIYGEIYTYKPALTYWLAALPYLLTDHPSELLLRLPFAACGLLMGLAVLLLIGRASSPETGFVSAVASITAAGYVQKVRVGEFDIVVTAGVGLAVAAACVNLSLPRPRPALWALAYLGLAFGFLGKGVPALMAYGPGLLLAAGVNRRLRLLLRWDHLAAGFLFLLPAAGYLLAGYVAEGGAFFEQPLQEARVRGLEWTWRQVALTLTKPAIIWAVLLPWTVVLPFLSADRSWLRSRETEASLVRASGAFFVAGILSFMSTPTHEVRYYLPLSVSAGILFGVSLSRREELSRTWRRRRAAAVVALAYLAASGVALSGLLLSPQRVPLQNRGLLVLAGLAAILAVRRLAGASRRPLASLLLIAALSLATAENFGYRPHREWKRSLRGVAESFRPLIPGDAPVHVLGPADMAGKSCSLYFYLDRPIQTFRFGSELPPSGSYCIFDSRELVEIQAARDDGSPFSYSTVEKLVHPYSTYHLVKVTGP